MDLSLMGLGWRSSLGRRFLLPFLFVCVTLVSGCRKQQTCPTRETFDVSQAMWMFYGNYDAQRQTSTVTFSKMEPVRIHDEPMTVRGLFYTLSGDPAAPNFVLLTYAVPASDEKYYCHACAPTIGMALFSQKGAGWIMT